MGKSVRFSDDVSKIPEDILDPYLRPFTSCKDDAFCSSLKASFEVQERSASVLQRFCTKHIPVWRKFNNKKTKIIEDMDDVLLIQKGEMERVADFIVDMKREAEMEAAEEYDGEEISGDDDLKAEVEQQKRRVKELETENASLKTDTEELKNKNKKLAMDTFGLYESFGKAVSDVKGLESEQKRLEQICSQYAKVVKTLKGMMKAAKLDIKRERKERKELEDCINGVILVLEERTNKKKLINSLLKMKSSLSTQVEQYGLLPVEV